MKPPLRNPGRLFLKLISGIGKIESKQRKRQQNLNESNAKKTGRFYLPEGKEARGMPLPEKR
jgi:hypothetical protein